MLKLLSSKPSETKDGIVVSIGKLSLSNIAYFCNSDNIVKGEHREQQIIRLFEKEIYEIGKVALAKR